VCDLESHRLYSNFWNHLAIEGNEFVPTAKKGKVSSVDDGSVFELWDDWRLSTLSGMSEATLDVPLSPDEHLIDMATKNLDLIE
jgi:hypothetical protein